jgi:hypothetical protein
MARERRGTLRKPKKVGDLKARAARAGAVKGGIVINWAPQTGADRPGETQGVIAIIKPGGTR